MSHNNESQSRIMTILYRSRTSVITMLILSIYLNVIIHLPGGIGSITGVIATTAMAGLLAFYIGWLIHTVRHHQRPISVFSERTLRPLNYLSGLCFGYYMITCLFRLL